MMLKKVKISLKCNDPKVIPQYASTHAAGADLVACINENIIIKPHTSVLIPTGLFMEIPPGYEVQIRPRSGLALKHQITVLNTPGTIDADYRGEVGVILMNHSDKEFAVEPYMRIAQMVVAPAYAADFSIENELSTTQRGQGGFGSSGIYKKDMSYGNKWLFRL